MDPFTEKDLIDALRSMAITMKEIKHELSEINTTLKEAQAAQAEEDEYEVLEDDDDLEGDESEDSDEEEETEEDEGKLF